MEPAQPPLIVEPVALMRLVEIDEIGEALDQMKRLGLGPGDFLSETKFNGWLVQSAGGRLWSRRGNIDLTGKFPEIARAVAKYDRDHLAGELIYWAPGETMSEPTVTTVAGTKNDREAVAKLRALPGRFEYVVFDALALRGYEVARLPLQERKQALLEVVKAAPPLRISMEHPFEAWEEVYDQGVAAGGDGVVLKNRRAPYVWRPLDHPEPRPVGNQYKLKPVVTDDFVVFDTAKGPKGRLLLVFGQFHHGQLVPVGEVDNLARDLEREVLRRIAGGPFVVELEFQGRFPDPPGALQHARFARFRDDKRPEDAALPEQYAPKAGLGLGIDFPEPTFSACRMLLVDPSRPDYLSSNMFVRSDLTDDWVHVALRVENGKPGMPYDAGSVRPRSFDEVNRFFHREAEKYEGQVKASCQEKMVSDELFYFTMFPLSDAGVPQPDLERVWRGYEGVFRSVFLRDLPRR